MDKGKRDVNSAMNENAYKSQRIALSFLKNQKIDRDKISAEKQAQIGEGQIFFDKSVKIWG